MLLHILTSTTWRTTILHWMKIRFLNQDNLFFLLLNKLFLAEEKCIVDYCCPFQDEEQINLSKEKRIHGWLFVEDLIFLTPFKISSQAVLERTIHEYSHYDIAVSPS